MANGGGPDHHDDRKTVERKEPKRSYSARLSVQSRRTMSTASFDQVTIWSISSSVTVSGGAKAAMNSSCAVTSRFSAMAPA